MVEWQLHILEEEAQIVCRELSFSTTVCNQYYITPWLNLNSQLHKTWLACLLSLPTLVKVTFFVYSKVKSLM